MSLRVILRNSAVSQSSGCALLSSTGHTPYLHHSQPHDHVVHLLYSTAKTAKWAICMQMQRCHLKCPAFCIYGTGGSRSMQNSVITDIHQLSVNLWLKWVSRTFAYITANKHTPKCNYMNVCTLGIKIKLKCCHANKTHWIKPSVQSWMRCIHIEMTQ